MNDAAVFIGVELVDAGLVLLMGMVGARELRNGKNVC